MGQSRGRASVAVCLSTCLTWSSSKCPRLVSSSSGAVKKSLDSKNRNGPDKGGRQYDKWRDRKRRERRHWNRQTVESVKEESAKEFCPQEENLMESLIVVSKKRSQTIKAKQSASIAAGARLVFKKRGFTGHCFEFCTSSSLQCSGLRHWRTGLFVDLLTNDDDNDDNDDDASNPQQTTTRYPYQCRSAQCLFFSDSNGDSSDSDDADYDSNVSDMEVSDDDDDGDDEES